MLDRLLGLSGAAVVLGATVWALVGGPTAPITTVVVIGLVLAAADAVVWRGADPTGGAERYDLAVPDLAVPDGRRLPGPPWGALVAVVATLGLVATLLAGTPVGAAGMGLVLAVTLAGVLRPAPEERLPPRVASAALRLRRFARAHGTGRGDPANGYVTPVGESGARLFVVAADGSWADAMLSGDDAAAVAELARVELLDPTDPAAGQRLHIGQQTWDRMARSW